MSVSIPLAMSRLFDAELVYNALRQQIPLPAYVPGSFYVTEECVSAVKEMKPIEQAQLVYDAIYEAHETVRKSQEAQWLIPNEGEDGCEYARNVFLELPLAGYEVFRTWVAKILPWLQVAGFDLDCVFSDAYQRQMVEIEKIDFEHIPLLTNYYLLKRREFVEYHGIADEGDLRNYIADKANDVFGVIYGSENCTPMHQQVRMTAWRWMYTIVTSPLRVTRDCRRAHGHMSPIDW